MGAFHGLSRERSDARKYPAIHPLDSWSKYAGVIKDEKVEYGRRFLRRGSEVEQMMKVVGEEGTSMEDFVIYLKGSLLDSVYLQQNSFDKVDGAVSVERQQHVFKMLIKILGSAFSFDSKDDARSFFNKLRLLLIDYNYLEWGSQDLKIKEDEIENMVNRKAGELEVDAKRLLEVA